MERGRQRVFNLAMNILDTHTLSQKLDKVFKKLECVAKLNVAFGFVLKNVDDGIFRFYYAHEKNFLMERSKLVETEKCLIKNQNEVSNTDVIEACRKQRANTK